jgi:hypothetical protein
VQLVPSARAPRRSLRGPRLRETGAHSLPAGLGEKEGGDERKNEPPTEVDPEPLPNVRMLLVECHQRPHEGHDEREKAERGTDDEQEGADERPKPGEDGYRTPDTGLD